MENIYRLKLKLRAELSFNIWNLKIFAHLNCAVKYYKKRGKKKQEPRL